MPSTLIPLGRDSTTGQIKSWETGDILLGASSSLETVSEYLVPETKVATQSTRGDQTYLVGASYIVNRNMSFNRVIVRCQTSGGVGTTIAVAIYQETDGMSGNTINKVATCTGVATAGSTNLVMTPSEGSVTLKMGLCYVVWGRDSVGGSFTMRTHTVQNYDLLVSNVDADTHPTAFTTAINATALPATIDVRQPVTGDLTPTTTDAPLVVVLKKV